MTLRLVRRAGLGAPEVYVVEEDSEISMTVVDLVVEGMSRSQIGNDFRRLDAAYRWDERLVLRAPSPSYVTAVARDEILQRLLAHAEVAVMAPSGTASELGPFLWPVPGFRQLSRMPDLTAIRRLETKIALLASRAVLGEPGVHYCLPSGMHADKFIHPGRLLGDVVTVSRLVDWILPALPNRCGILADTSTLYPMLQEIRFQRLRAALAVPPVAVLAGYPCDPLSFQRALTSLFDALEGHGSIVLLLSVSSSGRYSSLFKRFAPPESIGIALVRVETEVIDHELDDWFAPVEMKKYSVSGEGSCEMCRGSELLIVEPETWEIRPRVTQKAEGITPARAGKHREFWEAVSRTGALRLHFAAPHTEGGETLTRHHAYYLDVEKLLADSWFHLHCRTKLESIGRPDVVLVPKHAKTEVVTDLVKETFPDLDALQVAPVDSGILTGMHADLLSRASRVLICDDALVSGHTLRSLKSSIYEVCQRHRLELEIDCFVAVARPAVEEEYKAVVRPFWSDRRSHLHYGWKLLLPRGVHCPWCDELKLLTSFARTYDGVGREAFLDRIRFLEGPGSACALVTGGFPANNGETIGSFFGTLTPDVGFAAAACATHELLEEFEATIHLNESKTVNLAVVVEAYFETCLLAGILRTTHGRWVRPYQDEHNLEACLAAQPTSAALPGLLAELGMAAVRGVLPHGPVSRILSKLGEPDARVLLTKELIRELLRTP